MNIYQRLDYWSPTLGCEVSRISMVDKNGDEYFVTIPRESGRQFREAKDKALDALEEAIGDDTRGPGEVIL